MKRFLNSVVALATALSLVNPAWAITLETDNKDAVKLSKAPYFNLSATEASNTSYKLTSKRGYALSSTNYGILGIGSNSYDITKDVTLTQGACNTLWGSTTNRDVHLYAAHTNSQGTSTSASSPSTDISGGSDTNFKVAVDKNPVVSVTLTLTGLDTGAEIAAALETEINEALEAAGQGGRVDAEFASSLYVVTSRNRGPRSSVVFTAGASANVADNLKLGAANSGVEVEGTNGPQLCVSDVAGKTQVGSVAVGAAGYVSCTATLPSSTTIRQIASADLNCTGPVIGTLREANVSADGYGQLPIKKYGTASSTTTGAAALVFNVKGLESGDDCVVTPVSLGSGPAHMTIAAVTADTLTVTFDANQTSGTTVVNYACW
jgi:hypothetical protein